MNGKDVHLGQALSCTKGSSLYLLRKGCKIAFGNFAPPLNKGSILCGTSVGQIGATRWTQTGDTCVKKKYKMTTSPGPEKCVWQVRVGCRQWPGTGAGAKISVWQSVPHSGRRLETLVKKEKKMFGCLNISRTGELCLAGPGRVQAVAGDWCRSQN